MTLSADFHPDRVHTGSEGEKKAAQEHYANLNAAYNRLRVPKDRLQHLLELEAGGRLQQVQQIPPDLMEISLEVARLCRQADAFLREKARTTSPLLQVQMFERGQEMTEQLNALQRQMNSRHEALLQELKNVDAEWPATARPDSPQRGVALESLERLYRFFSYVARWNSQIQERIVQLSF